MRCNTTQVAGIRYLPSIHPCEYLWYCLNQQSVSPIVRLTAPQTIQLVPICGYTPKQTADQTILATNLFINRFTTDRDHVEKESTEARITQK